jgi:hypothetical protein
MAKRGKIYSRAPVDLPTIKQEILEHFSKPVGRQRRAQQSVYGVRGPKRQGYDGPADDIDEFSQRQDYLFVQKFLSTQVFVAYFN